MAVFQHERHPWQDERARRGPTRVVEQHPSGSVVQRFNAKLAVHVTRVVGSMWCAYAFGLFDLISLPAAIRGGIATTVAWIAQTFLQLVLLSVIMVGQNVQAEASDKRSEQTFNDTELLVHYHEQLVSHLDAQDAVLREIQVEVTGVDRG